MAKRTWSEAFPCSSICAVCDVLLLDHDPEFDVHNPTCLMCTETTFGAQKVGFRYVMDKRGRACWGWEDVDGTDDEDTDDDGSEDSGTDYSDTQDSVGCYEEDADTLHLLTCSNPSREMSEAAYFANDQDSEAFYDAACALKECVGSARHWHQLRLTWLDMLLHHGCRGAL